MTLITQKRPYYSSVVSQLQVPFASSEVACLSNGPQCVRSYDLEGHLAGVAQSTVRNISPSTVDLIPTDVAVKNVGPGRPTISTLSIPPQLTTCLPDEVSPTIVAVPQSREVRTNGDRRLSCCPTKAILQYLGQLNSEDSNLPECTISQKWRMTLIGCTFILKYCYQYIMVNGQFFNLKACLPESAI
ncbi:hypothetical protein ACFL7M_14265 [Thermodesulfobacteriota bacterium]